MSIQQALEALKNGNAQEAEKIMTAAVKEAEEKSGKESSEYASAEFDLAKILVSSGQLPKAAEALRRAADVPAKEGQPQKMRLDYLTNLGEVLARMNQLDEALKVHEESLTEREKAFGKNSEGYAYGQAPVAEVYLAKGDADAAERNIEAALAVLWKAGRPQVVPFAALRAAIRSAKYADERPLLEPFDALPLPLRVELIKICLARTQRDNPKHSIHVLEELKERIEDALDEVSSGEPYRDATATPNPQLQQVLPQVVATYSNIAAAIGNHEARISSLQWLRKHLEENDDKPQALEVSVGLGLARDAAGDLEGAMKEFEESITRAEPLGHTTRARVLRNYGVFLSRKNKKEEADAILVQAVQASEASGEQEGLGSSLVAQAVHFHHTERLEEAKPVFTRAVSVLPEKHPDSQYAKLHLNAMDKNQPCGCNDPKTALARTIAALVQPHLPKGLLAGLSVKSLENLSLEVALSRQPTPEEQEQLNRALNNAINTLKRQQANRQQTTA